MILYLKWSTRQKKYQMSWDTNRSKVKNITQKVSSILSINTASAWIVRTLLTHLTSQLKTFHNSKIQVSSTIRNSQLMKILQAIHWTIDRKQLTTLKWLPKIIWVMCVQWYWYKINMRNKEIVSCKLSRYLRFRANFQRQVRPKCNHLMLLFVTI